MKMIVTTKLAKVTEFSDYQALSVLTTLGATAALNTTRYLLDGEEISEAQFDALAVCKTVAEVTSEGFTGGGGTGGLTPRTDAEILTLINANVCAAMIAQCPGVQSVELVGGSIVVTNDAGVTIQTIPLSTAAIDAVIDAGNWDQETDTLTVTTSEGASIPIVLTDTECYTETWRIRGDISDAANEYYSFQTTGLAAPDVVRGAFILPQDSSIDSIRVATELPSVNADEVYWLHISPVTSNPFASAAVVLPLGAISASGVVGDPNAVFAAGTVLVLEARTVDSTASAARGGAPGSSFGTNVVVKFRAA